MLSLPFCQQFTEKMCVVGANFKIFTKYLKWLISPPHRFNFSKVYCGLLWPFFVYFLLHIVCYACTRSSKLSIFFKKLPHSFIYVNSSSKSFEQKWSSHYFRFCKSAKCAQLYKESGSNLIRNHNKVDSKYVHVKRMLLAVFLARKYSNSTAVSL